MLATDTEEVWRSLIGMTVRLDRWEIVSPDPKKPIALFHFEVQLTTGSAWTVSQRYSGLREFHRQLSSKLPDVKLPTFPSKKVLSEAVQQIGMTRMRVGSIRLASGKDHDFMERRAVELAKYLSELVQIAQVRDCPDFQSFMLIPKTVTAPMRRVSVLPEGTKVSASKSVNLVFGAPLADVVAHECNEGDSIPLIFRVTADYLAQHGLYEEGLFRVPAMSSELDRLKTIINQGNQRVDFSTVKDRINVAGGLLKQYLRELPEPLLGPRATEFIAIADQLSQDRPQSAVTDSLDEPPGKRADLLAALIAQLPLVNQRLLEFFLLFLRQVASLATVNKMTAENLAVVFGPPLLLGSRSGDISVVARDSNRVSLVVATIIRIPTHFLFPSSSSFSSSSSPSSSSSSPSPSSPLSLSSPSSYSAAASAQTSAGLSSSSPLPHQPLQPSSARPSPQPAGAKLLTRTPTPLTLAPTPLTLAPTPRIGGGTPPPPAAAAGVPAPPRPQRTPVVTAQPRARAPSAAAAPPRAGSPSATPTTAPPPRPVRSASERFQVPTPTTSSSPSTAGPPARPPPSRPPATPIS